MDENYKLKMIIWNSTALKISDEIITVFYLNFSLSYPLL